MASTGVLYRERAREISVVAEVDVVVAGGGPSGIAAAFAAAREGAETVLVERFGYLGGMITGSHVVWVFGAGNGHVQMARGITAEIRNRLEPFGAVTPDVRPHRDCGDYAVDAETFKWQAAEMLSEEGVQIRLHALACSPIMNDRTVAGVITESKSGREAILAHAIVDCTADADIAARAGCSWDNETHDVTLRVTLTGVDQDAVSAFRSTNPERFCELREAAEALNGGVMLGHTRYLKQIDVADAAALTQAELTLRHDYFLSLHFLREHMPGWENARISGTDPQLGVRQGRRVHGEYTLTDEDLRSSRKAADSVARLGSFLLGYKLYDPSGLDYDVPYRSLLPRSVDGLLVAGRCISCDYLACNTMRLIVPCLATGQGAGVAAAIAAREGVAPRRIDTGQLQEALRRQDVYLG